MFKTMFSVYTKLEHALAGSVFKTLKYFLIGYRLQASNKYRLKSKEKNKSREEIFYQMKVFFVKISCRKCFL